MLNLGKKNVCGILISVIDYDAAVEAIFSAASRRRNMTVSALAVHGVMTGARDPEQKFRLNRFDLLVADGQPVRWVLNLFYRVGLSERVYGPNLMLRCCARAASEGKSVFLYGSTPEVIAQLRRSLETHFPGIQFAGTEPSRFRQLTSSEKFELIDRIRASHASMLFVGLGCPRQEVFAYEFKHLLPMPIVAVGAAFPFLAGLMPQAPTWMQNLGLEWLFRLHREPRRLWRRYVWLNPAYILLVILQVLRLSSCSTAGKAPSNELWYG